MPFLPQYLINSYNQKNRQMTMVTLLFPPNQWQRLGGPKKIENKKDAKRFYSHCDHNYSTVMQSKFRIVSFTLL